MKYILIQEVKNKNIKPNERDKKGVRAALEKSKSKASGASAG
jgi:hypothetical protein